MTAKSDGAFPDNNVQYGLTAVEYAAIHLCAPDSGTLWLDAMIQKARRDRFAAASLTGFRAGSARLRDNPIGTVLSDVQVANVARQDADALISELDNNP